MICPYCGQYIETRRVYCPFCGEALPEQKAPRASRAVYVGAALGLLAAAALLATVAAVASRWLNGRSQSPMAGAPSPTVAWAEAETLPAPATATPGLAPTGEATAPPAETSTLVPAESEEPTQEPSATVEPSATSTWTPMPPPVVVCPAGRDSSLAALAADERLGCALAPAEAVWSAWQPFERGYMLWRSDTRQITVLKADGSEETYGDQWDGKEYSTGAPPAGKIAPTRGFGWVWASHEEVAEALGWALEPEKGFCAWLQEFEGGYVFRSSVDPCSSEYNRAAEPGFRPLFIESLDTGSWAQQ